MSKDKKAPQSFKAPFSAGYVEGLFNKSRKTLFLDSHPLSGMKTKDLGFKNGKAFYNMDKQELTVKDGAWEIKAELGKQNVELQNELDNTTSVKFGVNGIGKDPKVFCGGTSSFGLATVQATIFSDLAAEVSSKASVAGLDLAGDVTLSSAGLGTGSFGASYGLPMGKKTAVGAVVAYPEMDTAVCAYTDAAVPGTDGASLGAELHLPSGGDMNALVGAKVALDKQLSIKAAAGLNGICHISFIQAFKDMQLTAGMEADLMSGAANPTKFGMELKMAK